MSDTAPATSPGFTFANTKRSPGRPRKETSPTSATPRAAAKSNADTVTRALASMRAIYGTIAVGLTIAGLHASAEELAGKVDNLNDANREAFEASPKLAELIAGAAPIAAVSTFFIAHATTGFAVASVARKEMAEKRAAQKPADVPAEYPTGTYSGTPAP